MLRGFYTAISGMQTQREKLNVITNNLANADTTAFKSDSLVSGSFKEMMIERMNGSSFSPTVGTLGLGTQTQGVVTSFLQGNPEETGRSCDFALNGQGFFAVSTPNGTMYTRDGSFSVTSDGYLVTSEGYYVQGSNGKINVGNDTFKVDENGNVTVGDAITDKLKIVKFADLNTLEKAGNGYYTSTGTATTDTDTKVEQGYLEASNVNVSDQLSDMMSLSNEYQSNQRVLKMIDGTLDKAVNEVGKV
jgi:flagellar basal-body rod protein FlgF